MRTDDEIVSRIEARKKWDLFGFEVDHLVIRLPFDRARPYLKLEITADGWKECPRGRESVLDEMLAYMPFAWEKANGKRGISAGRSMCHYNAWIWLAGDNLGDMTKYEFYGKDNLVRICQHYGWDSTQWDDGERHN